MWKPSWFLVLLDSSVQSLLIYSLQSHHREKRLFFFFVSKLFPKCWACVLIRVLLSTSKSFSLLVAVNCSSEESRIRNELCGFWYFNWMHFFPLACIFWYSVHKAVFIHQTAILISDFSSLSFISISVPCYTHLCLLILILSFWFLSFMLVMSIQFEIFIHTPLV